MGWRLGNLLEASAPSRNEANNDFKVGARGWAHICANPLVDPTTLNLEVSDGWLLLTGEVHCELEKITAEGGLVQLEGVVGVVNRISTRPHIPSWELEARLGSALNAPIDLSIHLSPGRIRLEGTVSSIAQHKRIFGAIWSIPGVRTIQDNLRLVDAVSDLPCDALSSAAQ